MRGSIVDLARARTDGYDLTEWLAERDEPGCAGAAPGARGARRQAARRRAGGWPVRVGGYAASSPGSLSGGCALGWLPVVRAPGVARVRIARTVPCETWAAAAISRWESPSRPARLMACSYSLSASRLRLAARVTLPQHVAAELLPGAQLAVAFGVGDRARRGRGRRRRPSSYGHELVKQRRQDGPSAARPRVLGRVPAEPLGS